jgi:hypothetical protein
MTVRGGGIPRRPLALTPNGRMGPPLRSFAADAHDCIMVRVLGPTGYKVVARLNRARKRAPSDRHPDRTKRCHRARSRQGVAWQGWSVPQGWCDGQPRQLLRTLASAKPESGRRNGFSDRTKKLTKEKDEPPCLNFLTKKAPYKGPGADSEEKHEPVSDIDTAEMDRLKALDPNRPIREADKLGCGRIVR